MVFQFFQKKSVSCFFPKISVHMSPQDSLTVLIIFQAWQASGITLKNASFHWSMVTRQRKSRVTYTVGFSSITYELECGTDERIFVYSGFDGNITIRNTNGDFEEETDVFGPTLVEINGSEGKHELAFFFDLDKEEEKPLTVMRMKKDVSGGLEKATCGMTGDAFSFRKADLPQKHSGPYALITSVTYDSSVKVTVNGKTCRTFNYLGLLGCVFDGGEGTEDYSVSIAKSPMT